MKTRTPTVSCHNTEMSGGMSAQDHKRKYSADGLNDRILFGKQTLRAAEFAITEAGTMACLRF